MIRLYYNSEPRSALKIAKANRLFYIQFVQDYIPNSLHIALWTGKQLEGLISDLKNELYLPASADEARDVKEEISFYTNLYKYLTKATNYEQI